jgi:hypothetical protein
MDCQFDECQYEDSMNAELTVDEKLYLSTGQSLETVAGIDSLLYVLEPQFWRLFPTRFSRRKGIIPGRPRWPNELLEPEQLPNFRFNVFLQYKVPAFLTQSNSNEWNFWRQEYFRYKLMDYQQRDLENLENEIGAEGLVAYSSPSFWKNSELFDYVKHQSVIDNSNFVEANKLSGHDVYTYTGSGRRNGKAFSEPEEIETFDLKEKIQKLRELEPSTSNVDFFKKMEMIFNSVMETSYHAEEYWSITEGILDSYENELDLPDDVRVLLKTLIKGRVFTFLTKTEWFLGH